MAFTVEVLTPDSIIVKGLEADAILIPTVRGQINILPEHTHVVSKLDTGVLTCKTKDGDREFSITTGVCKVLQNKVTILTNVSEESVIIDIDRAKAAMQKAKTRLEDSDSLSYEDFMKFTRKVERAEMRIQLALHQNKR
jgi:F-type H+-transporting ATPase subunit epsilon